MRISVLVLVLESKQSHGIEEQEGEEEPWNVTRLAGGFQYL